MSHCPQRPLRPRDRADGHGWAGELGQQCFEMCCQLCLCGRSQCSQIAGSCCSGRIDVGGQHPLAEVKEDPDFNAANDAGITASPSTSNRLPVVASNSHIGHEHARKGLCSHDTGGAVNA